MRTVNFYSSYADHMWRVYIRSKDGLIQNISEPDRVNCSACQAVYNRVRPDWQTIIHDYYQRKEQSMQNMAGLPRETVKYVIRSAQEMAAAERGLIVPRNFTEKE